MDEIKDMAEKAKRASRQIARLTTEEKDRILLKMADALDLNRSGILEANRTDVAATIDKCVRESMIDRLLLDDSRIDLMIRSIRDIAGQKDYVGELISKKMLENGLELSKVRAGFGVIGIIYESRPNVTSDVCAICLKSSSAAILKGGSDALNTNRVLIKVLQDACYVKDAFSLIDFTDRDAVNRMLQLTEYIDLIIPRGGGGLIHFVRDNSRIPVIETGTGNCHIYVDADADVDEAISIIMNAKTQRPGVCNAAEKVLVHKDISEVLLGKLALELEKKSVRIRGCKRTQEIIRCEAADDDDWKKEYLDLVIGIRVVDSLEDAIHHINRYGSRHSEAILSRNKENIERFLAEVDAAAVYSNASTRFTDGCEFGLGAEIGISTQKMHARGPMGLKAMTTTKYVIRGDGQVRE